MIGTQRTKAQLEQLPKIFCKQEVGVAALIQVRYLGILGIYIYISMYYMSKYYLSMTWMDKVQAMKCLQAAGCLSVVILHLTFL